MELISLKEEQLLEATKAALLAKVQSKLDDVGSVEAEEVHREENQIELTQEHTSWRVGQQCSVPGWTANGKYLHENAIICEVINNDNDVDSASSCLGRVRVILAHPTHFSDIPCDEFFSSGSCHRGIRCPRSHGKVVNLEDLGEWHDPDINKYMREGQPCLARNNQKGSSLIWRHAHILHTDLESGTCVVEWGHRRSGLIDKHAKRKSYDSLESSVSNLPIDCVHILSDDEGDNNDDDSDDPIDETISSSTDDSDGDDDEWTQGHDLNFQVSLPDSSLNSHEVLSDKETKTLSHRVHRSKISFVFGATLAPDHEIRSHIVQDTILENEQEGSNSSFGAWEAHTRGIGSRLLALMGYPGSGGLGVQGQGHPVPVALSLEKFQIRAPGWNKRPSLDRVVRKKCNRINGSNKISSSSDKPTKSRIHDSGLFHFMNMALGSTNSNSISSKLISSKTEPVIVSTNKDGLQRQLFETHENIERTLVKIARAKEAIKRNEGRDRIAAKQAQERLDSLQSELKHLRQTQRVVEASKNRQSREKKMRIF